jgi:hypothetical protein
MSVTSDLSSLELVNPGTQAYAYVRVTVRGNNGALRNAVKAATSPGTTPPSAGMGLD